MRGIYHTLVADEGGVTGIEYALLASMIAIAAMSGISSLGNTLKAQYGMIDSRYQQATS